MTYEEAIQLLRESKKYWARIHPIYKAHDVAVEALEKQIPKKIFAGSENCPSCGEEVVGCEFYCWACGQKLEW